jgi:hypothetical protein
MESGASSSSGAREEASAAHCVERVNKPPMRVVSKLRCAMTDDAITTLLSQLVPPLDEEPAGVSLPSLPRSSTAQLRVGVMLDPRRRAASDAGCEARRGSE